MGKKRFGLRSVAGIATIAAVVLVALATAGGSLATPSTFDPTATYTSIAGTDLHSSQVGSTSDTFTSECSEGELDQLGTGEVLWHFVLVQTTDLSSGTLRAEFENAGVTDVTYSKFVGGVVHWNVITPSSDTLLAASTDATGAILNLSHVCGGGGSGGQTSDISTTVHLGATDGATPTVVDNANPAALGSTVHDSAALTFTGGGTLPTDSTVYFSFFENNDCTTPADDTASVDVGGESSPAGGLDPALAEGPLGAGGYSYVAVFVSGDSSVVGDSIGDCEPFTISQGTPSTSTEIHVGQTDSGTPIVVPTAGIDPGGYVHDSATVTGITGFTPGGTVSFTWYTNGTCTGAGTAAGTIALVNGVADPSTAEGPLAPGDYSFKAAYSGDTNYTAGDPSACEPLHVFRAALTIGYWKTHTRVCGAREKTGTDGCNTNGPFAIAYLGTSVICSPTCSVTVGRLSSSYATGASVANALAVFNANNCSNASTSDSNAAACLAAQLLGAELNVANGANTCICNTIKSAIAALTAVHYSGPGGAITLSGSGYTRANLITLKTQLDTYNNGGGCPTT
jgi:hypothetical protein